MRSLVFAAALAVSAVAIAQDARPPTIPVAVQPTRDTVSQKERLVQRLLHDSPAARRIDASSNEEAKKFFAQAHEQHDKAGAALAAGDYAGSDALLNEALWLIGKARQLVPDTMYRVVEWRFRYQRLQDVVDALNASYEKHLTRANVKPVEQQEIARLIADARSYRTSEQIPEAVATLERAQSMLLGGLNRLLGSSTLVYAEKFDTPADELAHEMQKNRSYGELVPIAISQLKPEPEAMRLVARYIESNQTLSREAQQHAARKNYTAALKATREGTQALQRALGAAGVVVPQDMNGQ